MLFTVHPGFNSLATAKGNFVFALFLAKLLTVWFAFKHYQKKLSHSVVASVEFDNLAYRAVRERSNEFVQFQKYCLCRAIARKKWVLDSF